MDYLTAALSKLSLEEREALQSKLSLREQEALQDREDDHLDHVRRLEQTNKKLAHHCTSLSEENRRLKEELSEIRASNQRWANAWASKNLENRRLRRENYGLKKLID